MGEIGFENDGNVGKVRVVVIVGGLEEGVEGGVERQRVEGLVVGEEVGEFADEELS